MSETYLPFVPNGRWTSSRTVNGTVLYLVQDSSLHRSDDAEKALIACNIRPTAGNLDEYFPACPRRGRRPTLEFMEIFAKAGKAIRHEVGV